MSERDAMERLRARNVELRKQLGTLGNRISEVEKRERAIALDRDHWRHRAHEAEAILHSLAAYSRDA